MPHEMTRRLEFDAGHRVPRHAGKCRTPHGHRYVVDVTIRGPLGREGFVLDFGEVKAKLGAWIDEHLDHTMIYQRGDAFMEAMAEHARAEGLRPFFAMDQAPTAEALAELLFSVAQRLLDADVVRVIVHETPNCSAGWAP
jgi:6-pyruvoyltetrahydropterin/6-carboxytetrahydropterin synthase